MTQKCGTCAPEEREEGSVVATGSDCCSAGGQEVSVAA